MRHRNEPNNRPTGYGGRSVSARTAVPMQYTSTVVPSCGKFPMEKERIRAGLSPPSPPPSPLESEKSTHHGSIILSAPRLRFFLPAFRIRLLFFAVVSEPLRTYVRALLRERAHRRGRNTFHY